MRKVKLGKYEHYKGKFYQVYGEAVHSETEEEFVLYKPLYNVPDPEKFRVRPKNMFLEKVEIKGKKVPRFKFLTSKP